MQAPSSLDTVPHGSRTRQPTQPNRQPRVCGKFLFVGDEKFIVRGVTYGTFRPRDGFGDFPDPQTVERDFDQMQAIGVNTVRTYTVPPRWLLDIAAHHGLWVIAGLPWEQHIAFLSEPGTRKSIEERVRDGVRSCAGHPAILAYAIGNEIPTQVVRWHGSQRVVRLLDRLHAIVRSEDPRALVTYANYPSTEYLDLPFIDFAFLNVYLESRGALEAYVARLQTLSGDKPLVIGELGLDSQRHGEGKQAHVLYNHLRTAYAGGCAGVCVFAWTDEWHRGGNDVTDWDFGLTRRDRRPKPALDVVSRAFSEVPIPPTQPRPRISVIVCTYNGAKTLRDCLEGLALVDYPDYEVIVVNDGSTDDTAAIASEFDVHLITTENRGLSHARNVGMDSATGEIVAYLDDDARPDPDWLTYLAHAFMTTPHAAVGGPNLSPPDDGLVAQAVDRSPGNPVHVLLTDQIAEHVPGCNLAVRTDSLKAVGGFDTQFRVAGDDVDLCWRLQQEGWTIGYCPTALVWHHRRGTARGYWRQQIGYGRAEGLLERKWPDKYNSVGHQIWIGRVYGNGMMRHFGRRQRIYQGTWGSAAYQSAEFSSPGLLQTLPTMPEWYVALAALGALSSLALVWRELLVFALVLSFALIATVLHAFRHARPSHSIERRYSFRDRVLMRGMATVFCLLQPIARLRGRMTAGLTPWRRARGCGLAWPRPRIFGAWSETWRSPNERLREISSEIRRRGYVVRAGGSYDRWDLEVRGGFGAVTRIQMLAEEHGGGGQYLRFRSWQSYSRVALLGLAFVLVLSTIAALDRLWIVVGVFGSAAALIALQLGREAANSAAAASVALAGATRDDETDRPTTSARRVDAVLMQAEQSNGPGTDDGVDPEGDNDTVGSETSSDGPPEPARRRWRRLKTTSQSGQALKRIVPYARPHWSLVIATVGITILGALGAIAAPWPLKFLIDNVLGDEPLPPILSALLGSIGDDRQALLIVAVLAGLLVTLLVSGLAVVENYVTTRLDQRMVLDFRSDLFRHAQRVSSAVHDQRRTGDFMYRINHASSAVGNVTVTVPAIAQNVITLIGMLVVALMIDAQLALLSLVVVPFLYYSTSEYARRIEPRLVRVRNMEGTSLSIVHEAMAMLRVIVAFGREKHEYQRFRTQGETAVDARVDLTVRQTVFSLSVSAISAIGFALVIGVGALHVIDGTLTIGELLVIIAYIQSIYTPLEAISNTAGSIQEEIVNLKAAFELLDTPIDIVEAPGAIALPRAKGDVSYRNVSFAYPERTATLTDISFDVPAGQVVAIVGPTGAGKSTLMSLLSRFSDPAGGEVLIDGTDVRRLRLDALRDNVSVVLQESLLFAKTVSENIRYGRLDATRAEIIQAAKDANAHDFITRMPNQYDTMLGERGARLSGGERQRIAVARAFLKDAPILVLDEPTSSIDSRTEAVILDALERLMRGRTTFMIAHRLSTIRHADLILVIDDGRLVQHGTHDDLIECEGLYRQLYETQAMPSHGGQQTAAKDAGQALPKARTERLEAAPSVGDGT